MSISNETVLAAIAQVIKVRGEEEGRPWSIGASRWDIAAVLVGRLGDVGGNPQEYPGLPEEAVMARLGELVQRGLVDGCSCGCRGDFMITETTSV